MRGGGEEQATDNREVDSNHWVDPPENMVGATGRYPKLFSAVSFFRVIEMKKEKNNYKDERKD